ncbi:MAG: HAD family phosphatase [Anaerolineae bacterium]|nr:HAD family phosphatase [Anaerolineae bacterium]
MIRAMIFDLDGTLVQTERLKALSYARAAIKLCPDAITEQAVLAAFKDVVGLSRREVAQTLVTRFNLETAARARMGEFGVTTAWQAFVQVRLRYYNSLLADPDVLRNNQWPHNVALLRRARESSCKTGLATMSYCTQVTRVLEVLRLTDQFDFVASRDDVEHGKPDPEIYQIVATELDVPPEKCLVIEDSPVGVEAALAAGMACIAVSTPFTHTRLHAAGGLPDRWIVDDPVELLPTVDRMLAYHRTN